MLTEQLTADAAALHQAILQHGGEVSPFFCGKELGWEHRRIARAMFDNHASISEDSFHSI